MFNFKPIALVSGTVICAVGFFLFIPLITELIYKTDTWQSYAVPILLYLIVCGSLVITNKNVDLNISLKEAFVITVISWLLVLAPIMLITFTIILLIYFLGFNPGQINKIFNLKERTSIRPRHSITTQERFANQYK